MIKYTFDVDPALPEVQYHTELAKDPREYQLKLSHVQGNDYYYNVPDISHIHDEIEILNKDHNPVDFILTYNGIDLDYKDYMTLSPEAGSTMNHKIIDPVYKKYLDFSRIHSNTTWIVTTQPVTTWKSLEINNLISIIGSDIPPIYQFAS